MRFFALLLVTLLSSATFMSTDAQAYWHGYRGGWHGGWGWHGAWGWRGPGCWRCGPGWGPGPVIAAGAVVAAGAAAAASGPPVVVAPPPVVVAPAAPVPISTSTIPPIGSTYPSLLPGCFLEPRNGINFYQCQGFRMRPIFGGNSFYYRVVPG